MENEIPKGIFSFDQVQEEDEETEKESSVSKRLDRFRKKSRNLPQVKTVGTSYYESSDSDVNSDNELPQDQAQKDSHYDKKIKDKVEKQSRLSQLSKFNLFALIQLANAWLIIKIQHDPDRALQIWNEAIMSLKVLSRKINSPIIALELIEHLVSQIIEFKTKELDDVVTKYDKCTKAEDEEIIEIDEGEGMSPEKVIAISESIEISPIKSLAEENKQDINAKQISIILNPREVIDLPDFYSIMSITTLVPFIKIGVPRLSEFDIRISKLNEKGVSKKNKGQLYSSKIFQSNFELREEIYRWQEEYLDHSQINQSQQAIPEINEKDSIAILIDDKAESNNIMNNPEIKREESESISFYAKAPRKIDKNEIKSQNERNFQSEKQNNNEDNINSNW